jgi:translocation and assembly module TamB
MLLLVVSLLLYSESGARWLLSLVDDLTPYEITTESLEGRLAGPLSIRGLSVSDGDLELDLNVVDFDWRPAALLRGELHLINLDLKGIEVIPPSAEASDETDEPKPFSGLSLPLQLKVERIAVEDVTIKGATESEDVRIGQLMLSAHSEGQQVNIDRFSLNAFSTQLDVRGYLRLSAGLPMDLNLDWRHQMAEGPALSGRGGIKGDLNALQLVQEMDAPLSSRLQAELMNLQSDPQWQADLSLKDSELGELIDYPLRLNGTLQSRGKPDALELSSDLSLWQPEYGDIDLQLQANYADRRFTARSLQVTTPTGVNIAGKGEYQLNDEMGRFSSELTWKDLRWPLQGEPVQVMSPQGTLQASGTPEAYQFELGMDAHPPGQPLTNLQLAGDGGLKQIELNSLVAKFVEGALNGSGVLSWDPALAWQFELTGQKINPANWQRDLPGRIDLSLTTQGEMGEDGIQAEFNLSQLEGILRDYPVKGESLVRLEGETLNVESLQLDSGKNHVEAKGSVADKLDLTWEVDAPELAAFWPGLRGGLSGDGSLSGPRQAPRLRAKLAGEDIRLGSNGVEGLKLDADLSLSGEQAVTLSLQADDLKAGAQKWESLALDLSGALPKHQLELQLAGDATPGVSVTVDAGWSDEGVWSGTLEQLDLKVPDGGEWQLKQPSDFSLAANAQEIERLCLTAEDANLCAKYSAADDRGWQAKADAEAFPLKIVEPWLPNGLQVSGNLDLDAQFTSKPGADPLGELSLQLPEVSLGLDLNNEAEQVTIKAGRLNATLDELGAKADMQLPLVGLGEIAGNGDLPGLTLDRDDWSQQPLSGRLRLEVGDLSRISLLSPKLQNAKGRIDGDIGLQGSLGKPKVSGGVDLVDASLDIPELGLELRELGMQVKAISQTELALTGSLSSGKGKLALDGKLELDGEAGFPLQLNLKGSDLTVANIPEAEVHVSPNIHFQRSGKAANLKGEVYIPFARIRPRALPESAVSNSDDLVVVSADAPEVEEADVPLSAELRIIFGKRVSFDGFGLRGKLTGRLLVIDEPKRPVIGRGRIGILEGTYRAYGQDLQIERGYALFVDSPVDNPGLDVRAIREVEDVIAGIRVSGTLKRPNIDLFSSPAMSESDVLTYLITGRAPGEGGGQSVGVMAALSASGAGAAAEEVARQFGLDELRVDAGNSLEEASVVAGTYLSPKLYLQYINELASRETKIRIRYDINKRLQLEAETGKSHEGDLFYTFDR